MDERIEQFIANAGTDELAEQVRRLARQVAEREAEIAELNHVVDGMTVISERAEAERDDYREALLRIVQWADAYPLDIFPEPDFKRAHEVMTAAGMTLDNISASNIRHVVTGVGKIAREALAAQERPTASK